MSVYKVIFQELSPKVNIDVPIMMKELGGFNFILDGTPRLSIWKKFPATVSGGDTSQFDFLEWQRNICFSLKAYNELHVTLEKYGEFLPIEIEKNVWFIFNILHSIKADENQSSKKIVNGVETSYVNSIGFNPAQKDLVFKTDYDGHMGIYCQSEFIEVVDHFAGLEFSKDLRDI